MALPALPVPATVASGMPITGSLWNAQVGAFYTWFTAGPYAVFKQTAAQSFANGAWTAITWQSIAIDTHGGWALANPSRYTAAVPGWYRVTAQADFTASASGGFRSIAIQVNGVNDAAHRFAKQQLQSYGSASFDDARWTSTVVRLNVGDYVEAIVYASSGAGTLAAVDGQPRMSVRWIGK
jgi:hypothetical protein